MTCPGALYQMHVDERLPEWAARLDAVYDVVWATSWQTDVLKCVAEPLGASVSRRDGGRGRVRFKTKAIAEHLRHDPRPFAWADDDLFAGPLPGPSATSASSSVLSTC